MASAKEPRLDAWQRDGFFVVRGALVETQLAALAEACDHVLAQVRAALPESGHSSTHIAGLFAPEYFRDRPAMLAELVNFASSRAVIDLVHDLGRPLEGELNLRDAQYFHEPSARDRDGDWHRDGDPGASATLLATAERRPTSLRYRVALAPDDHLEIVPGSHQRTDTPEELRMRRGPVRNGALAGGPIRVALEPGDVCVFDTWSIHRGRYRCTTLRRTLDLLFGFGPRAGRDFSELLKYVLTRA